MVLTNYPPNPPYWQFFIAIEEDLARTSRFVEFSEDNYNVHSIEFTRILLSSSSEVDVVAKEFCRHLSPASSCGNIGDYKAVILNRYPRFAEIELHISRFNLSRRPWDNWRHNSKLSWWDAYNNVKHERSEHYRQATLSTTLDSVAALFSLLLYYYRELEGDGSRIFLNPIPRLFSSNKFVSPDVHTNVWAFDLPDK